MDDVINKHLQDILDAVNEVESFFGDRPKYFEEFCDDLCLRREKKSGHFWSNNRIPIDAYHPCVQPVLIPDFLSI